MFIKLLNGAWSNKVKTYVGTYRSRNWQNTVATSAALLALDLLYCSLENLIS